MCLLDKGTGGLDAWPKAPSGGNLSFVKMGGGGSKSSSVKSGETVGNGMSNNSSSKSLDESILSKNKNNMNGYQNLKTIVFRKYCFQDKKYNNFKINNFFIQCLT